MDNQYAKQVIRFKDLLGQEWKTKEQAERSSHDIHLKFRNYIQEELLVTFSDGKLNNLATTKLIWESLDFKVECIKEICDIMDKG